MSSRPLPRREVKAMRPRSGNSPAPAVPVGAGAAVVAVGAVSLVGAAPGTLVLVGVPSPVGGKAIREAITHKASSSTMATAPPMTRRRRSGVVELPAAAGVVGAAEGAGRGAVGAAAGVTTA